MVMIPFPNMVKLSHDANTNPNSQYKEKAKVCQETHIGPVWIIVMGLALTDSGPRRVVDCLISNGNA
jgi:hypothetical protein